MKKLVASLLLVSSLASPVYGINLIVNSEVVESTQSPVQQNGTTLVPARIVSEQLGANVSWDSSSNTTTITKGNTTIKLTLNSTQATVNGQATTLSTAPIAVNGTTMIPVRFVSEALNVPIDWDATSQTVLINSNTSDLSKISNELNADKALQLVKNYSGQTAFSYAGIQSSYFAVYGQKAPEFYVFYPDYGSDGVYAVHTETGEIIDGGGSVQHILMDFPILSENQIYGFVQRYFGENTATSIDTEVINGRKYYDCYAGGSGLVFRDDGVAFDYNAFFDGYFEPPYFMYN
ncbi:MAG: hypothetical protein ATN36_06495 [Epulopiscium sp. Nele67-Bin005]|nr:MAG: hypothetical protein ATN36_06495 [Epulopiscium sp. Nele67-Bin005]